MGFTQKVVQVEVTLVVRDKPVKCTVIFNLERDSYKCDTNGLVIDELVERLLDELLNKLVPNGAVELWPAVSTGLVEPAMHLLIVLTEKWKHDLETIETLKVEMLKKKEKLEDSLVNLAQKAIDGYE